MTTSLTTRTPRARPSTDRDGGPALLLGRGHRRRAAPREVLGPVGQQPLAADEDGVPGDDALDPQAGHVRGVLHAGRSPTRSRAPVAMAFAIGCSEACSSAPRAEHFCAILSGRRDDVESVIRPVVTVPVLSSTMVSTRRVLSSTSGPLIRMPSWAPRPVPTISAVGVARPRAHGQAMIRTATAAVKAAPAPAPAPSQKARVPTDRAITIGTKNPEIRSASRCA